MISEDQIKELLQSTKEKRSALSDKFVESSSMSLRDHYKDHSDLLTDLIVGLEVMLYASSRESQLQLVGLD